jgi:hypothetical protein
LPTNVKPSTGPVEGADDAVGDSEKPSTGPVEGAYVVSGLVGNGVGATALIGARNSSKYK